jgi:beta-xylosidase
MKNIKLLLICFLAFACSGKKTAEDTSQTTNTGDTANQTQNVTYRNPVMPGDYADPSVIRVGEEYWATATSSEWAPLYPLLYSKNLVDWEIKGHVFPDKLPAWAEAHFWAPEITYDKGKFYIYYTAKKG